MNGVDVVLMNFVVIVKGSLPASSAFTSLHTAIFYVGQILD